jgi:hypothetical protein
MLVHCQIDTSKATADAATRNGANGADLARAATVAMDATMAAITAARAAAETLAVP